MKFLADECCDLDMVKELRRKGHDVGYIYEDNPGASDSIVLSNAVKSKRILITEDKDFGELVYRLRKSAFGIILLRFHPSDKNRKILRICEVADLPTSRIKGNFVVVDSEKIRIRPLK